MVVIIGRVMSLFTYNGYSGQRYSLTMSDAQSSSFNGDYQKGNTLLYIPTDDELSKMNFTSESDRTSFKKLDRR
jgi:hypothetical protein